MTIETLKHGGQAGNNAMLEQAESLGSCKLLYRDKLVARYSNGVSQSHVLAASVPCPAFRVSATYLDFGTCFVGQRQSRQVTIHNPSASDTWWKVQCTASPPAGSGEFSIEPESGFLEAFVTHHARNKALVTVYFTPLSETTSEAEFQFCGRLGEATHVIKVTGSGSYDGKYELK